MNQVKLETPCVLNGVVITEDMLKAIDMLQTGGAYYQPFREKKLDETVLDEKLTDCKDTIIYLVGVMQYDTSTDGNASENELLGRMYWMHDFFTAFRTPPELFEPEK